MMRAAILTLAFLLPAAAFAHESGVSYEVSQNGYTIDVGYSSPSPVAGEAVLFSFLLQKGANDASFSDAWVKVTDPAGKVMLATGVHNNPFGGPRLSYVFPAPGIYTVDVRYETDVATITESSFTIPVVPAATPWYKNVRTELLALSILELATLAGVLVLWRRARRR